MLYDADSCAVRIGAEELCDLAHKSGDIGASFRLRPCDSNIGESVYSKIYRAEGAYYTAEVPLSFTVKRDGLYYTVDAMANGVLKKDGRVRVDIIRKVRKYDFYAPPMPTYLSALKCCAYFYAVKQGLSVLSGRIFFVSSEDDSRIKHFDYYFETDDLRAHVLSLIDKISTRAKTVCDRVTVALPSAASCVFPYDELREGQEIMIRECYSAIKNGKRLFLQAPTGTGKTVAALYPASRALGNGLADKVFYLTSKSSTRREAYRGAAKLFAAGAKLRTVVIGAKEQVCICPNKLNGGGTSNLCDPVGCPYAAGYYDRCEGAISELLSAAHGYTLNLISQVAKKHRVCPYELSLDLSELCDIIICDYNYVFDPSVYFRRYFSDEGMTSSKYVFLIDEAHNLADRAKDMYSATLSSKSFERVYSLIDASEKEINGIFERFILAFRSLRKLCRDSVTTSSDGKERGFYLSRELLSAFVSELSLFKKKCDEWLKSNKEHTLANAVSDLLYDVKKYLCVSEYFDGRFFNYVYIEGELTCVKIFCLDPSNILDIIQRRAVSTVMFSATLTPSDYFSEILGGGPEAVRVSLPSPFDPSNLCVAVAGYVSARFDDRESSIKKYVSVIAATVSRKAGNYIAYFPSYECLEKVLGAFVKKYPDVSVISQKRGMSAEQKEEFLDFFKDDRGVLRVGFCVLGGSFSEGVDLPGGRLIGTVIFGVGLPGLSNERNIMREYYDVRTENGFDFAYTFPGMNNVLQAAGRVIRKGDDRGVVVLADDRYREERYISLYPDHWSSIKLAENASELASVIQKFWENSQNR